MRIIDIKSDMLYVGDLTCTYEDNIESDMLCVDDIMYEDIESDVLLLCLDVGDITYEDILKVMPFGNTMDVIEVTGADLITILEFSVQDYDPATRDGKFLQMSGKSFN